MSLLRSLWPSEDSDRHAGNAFLARSDDDDEEEEEEDDEQDKEDEEDDEDEDDGYSE